ncbi:MAG: F0F1 ATP synthase subunit delta [Chloroflexi bacterium]|nr:F0F1 ATP synthase subunit delta [Chloroflexota bacterium]MDA1226617.1 F0F1 ATP synthase subunit delta [Chloroflexota bacterium]
MLDTLQRLGVHLPSLLIYTVNFLVLWGVLYLLAFKPLMRKLKTRAEEEKTWAANKEDASNITDEAVRTRKELLTEARREGDALLRAAEELAERHVQDGLRRARKAAETQLKRTKDQLRQESRLAYQDLHHSFVELVMAAAERSLQRSLDEEEQQKLLSEATEELSKLTWEPPARKSIGFAIVTTAVPMSANQEKQISDFLAQMAKREVRTFYKVDPSVLGGISIRTGDTLVDMTISGRLDRLKHHLLTENEGFPPDSDEGAG